VGGISLAAPHHPKHRPVDLHGPAAPGALPRLAERAARARIGPRLSRYRPLFDNLDGLIEELLLHHEDQLSVMQSAFDGDPVIPFEVARCAVPKDLSDHQSRFAVAET
jgi:hypothetical protein